MIKDKKIITATEICEALATSHPVAGLALRRRRAKEGAQSKPGEGPEFIPSEVPEKIKIPDDKLQSQEAETDEVWDFRFDPYLGDCSWTQIIQGVECRCLITLTEVDNWMFGFTQQTYTPPPGIRLIITKGAKTRPEQNKDNKIQFGHRYNQSNIKVYIHRRSFRVELSKQYQEFATLADGAKTGGLAHVGFPIDWDEVPYDV